MEKESNSEKSHSSVLKSFFRKKKSAPESPVDEGTNTGSRKEQNHRQKSARKNKTSPADGISNGKDCLSPGIEKSLNSEHNSTISNASTSRRISDCKDFEDKINKALIDLTAIQGDLCALNDRVDVMETAVHNVKNEQISIGAKTTIHAQRLVNLEERVELVGYSLNAKVSELEDNLMSINTKLNFVTNQLEQQQTFINDTKEYFGKNDMSDATKYLLKYFVPPMIFLFSILSTAFNKFQRWIGKGNEIPVIIGIVVLSFIIYKLFY